MTDGQFRDIARRTMTPRSIAVQVVGFAIGVAIVAWIVKGALEAANAPGRAGIMESVSAAWQSRPWLVAGIAITTVLSLAIDGALFWLVLLPVRRLGFMEMQWVTYAAATSNFFPVRLGLPARYAYAMLANRMSFAESTAWFAATTVVILVSLGAVVAATAVDPHPDLVWCLLGVGVLAVGGLALHRMARLAPVQRVMGRWTPMLTTQSTYWVGTLLRAG
ncbi:MAG: hypothetical protein ACKOF7_07795, partial [Phycisphaerales bacterium]